MPEFFQEKEAEKRLYQLRLYLVFLLAVLSMAIIISRLYNLQYQRHDYFRAQSDKNRITLVSISPNRGLITDRNGVLLAHNESTYILEAIPGYVHHPKEALQRLQPIIPFSEREKERFLREFKQTPSYGTFTAKERISTEEALAFAAHQFENPGFILNARSIRKYPYGTWTAHAVGYIGRIDKKDLQQLHDTNNLTNYRGTLFIGKTGIEKTYESHLHGKTGYAIVEIDALGNPVRHLKEVSPQSGDNLTLSIDIRLQEAALEIMGAYQGAIVAIDPNNGEVLAMVSTPTFDANWMTTGLTSSMWQALNNTAYPLQNRATTALYPPGSTIKPLWAYMAMLEGAVDPQKRIYDTGVFHFPNSTLAFRDWKRGGHGWVDLHQAITVSCDTYFYHLAADVGINRLARYLRAAGFGRPTGIDLPSEKAGLVPDPQWKKKYVGKPWYPGETVIAGIGQGYVLATPLQLAAATATIANGGTSYVPKLAKSYVHDQKTVDILPQVVMKLEDKNNAYETIKTAMQAVMQPGGTAWRAAIGAPYPIAGKTGTAQIKSLPRGERLKREVPLEHRDHALFIAFAPADQPKIAVAVVVEHGGSGSSVAGPMARKILDFYLLGKPVFSPNDQTSTPAS